MVSMIKNLRSRSPKGKEVDYRQRKRGSRRVRSPYAIALKSGYCTKPLEGMLLLAPFRKRREVFRELAGGTKRLYGAFAVAGEGAGGGQLAKHPLGVRIGFGSAGEVSGGQCVLLPLKRAAAGLNGCDENAAKGAFQNQGAVGVFLGNRALVEIARKFLR